MFVTTVGDGNCPQNALVIPKGAFCLYKMRNEEYKKTCYFSLSQRDNISIENHYQPKKYDPEWGRTTFLQILFAIIM